MTDDPMVNAGPEPSREPPSGARRDARQIAGEFAGPVDEHFKQSLAGLLGRLGERAARQLTDDPQAAAAARRAALQAYDLACARRLKTALRAAGVVVAIAGVAAGTVFIATPSDSPPSRAMASTERVATPIEVATVAPEPVPPAPPPATPLAPATSGPSPAAPPEIVPVIARVTPETVSEPAPAPEPVPAALRRDEVREVQTRLHSFGFNPGPLDGTAGSMTRAAVMRYQQDREQLQTGAIDQDLLEQLRQDPAPQVAVPQVTQRAARSARASNAARQPDAFEPLRVAARDVERWFQSLGR